MALANYSQRGKNNNKLSRKLYKSDHIVYHSKIMILAPAFNAIVRRAQHQGETLGVVV